MDKSNEITAIPTLLDLLDLSGTVVTVDAVAVPKSRRPPGYRGEGR